MSSDKATQHTPAFSHVTSNQLVTTQDLHVFGEELLYRLRALIPESKPLWDEWLKPSEVLGLLRISTDTLRRLRRSGAIGFTKLRGTYYYSYTDIQKLMKRSTP